MLIITLQNSLGVQRSMVIYVNRSYSRSITSITGLTDIFMDQFLGIIKCIKERSANTVIILKAQLSIKGLKVVRNVSKVSYSQVSKLKLIIRASINLLKTSSSSSPLQSKINQLIRLLNLFLDLLRSSQYTLQTNILPYRTQSTSSQFICGGIFSYRSYYRGCGQDLVDAGTTSGSGGP